MRTFGIDKPDLRLPGLTDIRSAFTAEQLQTLAVDPTLPVVVVRIPKVGDLSRKERDDNRPLFEAKKGAKLLDDLKRLEKSFPESVAKLRELTTPNRTTCWSLLPAMLATHIEASDTKLAGRLSEREIAVLSAAGNFRVELARKYADRHGAFAVTDAVVHAPGTPAALGRRFGWLSDRSG